MSEQDKDELRTNVAERGLPMTEPEMVALVRAQLDHLYTAIDSFKSDLISQCADLITRQIKNFEQMARKSSPETSNTEAAVIAEATDQ